MCMTLIIRGNHSKVMLESTSVHLAPVCSIFSSSSCQGANDCSCSPWLVLNGIAVAGYIFNIRHQWPPSWDHLLLSKHCPTVGPLLVGSCFLGSKGDRSFCSLATAEARLSLDCGVGKKRDHQTTCRARSEGMFGSLASYWRNGFFKKRTTQRQHSKTSMWSSGQTNRQCMLKEECLKTAAWIEGAYALLSTLLSCPRWVWQAGMIRWHASRFLEQAQTHGTACTKR